MPYDPTDKMILLLDQPDDVFCEAYGWVSVDVPEDHARALLEDFMADENGSTPARPVGKAKRVWLLRDEPRKPADEQRWHPCEAGTHGAVEFWEFDATETRAVEKRV